MSRIISSTRGSICRVPGSSAVYLSEKGVLGNLGIYGPPAAPTSKYFLDLQAVKVDRLDVDRIVLVDGDTTVDLVKEFAAEPVPEGSPEGTEPGVDRMTWEWKLGNGKDAALAKTKVDGLLGSVVSIRAGDVADPVGGVRATIPGQANYRKPDYKNPTDK